MRDLNNSTDAHPILAQIRDENLEKLIGIRARSIQLSLKSLTSVSFALLNEAFEFKNLRVNSISWDESPAEIIEFIGKNDLVRPSDSSEALKRRLDGKVFKCYGLFHEKVSQPVAFVYIKLHQGVPSTLFNLYHTLPDEFDSCILYSISSPFRGLNGIEFGSKLIKSVVQTVKSEHAQIKTFSTFSPVPLFRQWLTKNSDRFGHLTDLAADQLDVHEPELMAACGEFLRTRIDPVARFHYRNGAKLGPIRFKGDTSLGMFKQSYGIQVNYIYYGAATC